MALRTCESLWSGRVPASRAVAVALAGLTLGCGGDTPTAPGKTQQMAVTPSPTKLVPSSGPFATTGRVLDAVTGSGLMGIAIRGAGLLAFSETTGSFTLLGLIDLPEPRPITVSGPGFVTRHAYLRLPGPPTLVPLISAGFDLLAFNQMLRAPHLQRWTTAPPLLIETRTLQFTDAGAPWAVGVPDVMTDSEYDDLVADLVPALQALSGHAFPGFASITRQNSAAGSTVPLLISGQITVARFVGLTASTGFWGYGRWQTLSHGEVVGGTIMLDAGFERSGSEFVASLRAHELGHAMGYNHVTLRPSVMNSAARLGPTVFDLEACRIAFQRQPGNRAPDIDFGSGSLNASSSTPTWGPPIR